MREWFKKIPFWVRNQYFITGIIFLVWIAFFDSYNFIYHYKLKHKKEGLEKELFRLQTATSQNKHFILQLQNPEFAEKYAREKFFMKKGGEDIFVIEQEQ